MREAARRDSHADGDFGERRWGGLRSGARTGARLGHNLLIVDDSAEVTACWRIGLGQVGYSVAACCSPLEAIRIVSSHPDTFDLLVTDLVMPHMTGIDLARRITHTCPGLPVVLCTGYVDAERRRSAREAGILALLEKPVGLRELTETVDSLLGR